jgi:rRNA maturation endonuclease Nob1
MEEDVPKDVIEEIKEYEEKYLKKEAGKKKAKFPSNKDIAEAILRVTGGIVYADALEELPEKVREVLREDGFDTRFVGTKRIQRLLLSLESNGRIKIIT